MDIRVYDDKDEMGEMAAAYCAGIVNKTVQQKKRARIILATGASQFKFLNSLVRMVIPWDKVTCFHLDETLGCPKHIRPVSAITYRREFGVEFHLRWVGFVGWIQKE